MSEAREKALEAWMRKHLQKSGVTEPDRVVLRLESHAFLAGYDAAQSKVEATIAELRAEVAKEYNRANIQHHRADLAESEHAALREKNRAEIERLRAEVADRAPRFTEHDAEAVLTAIGAILTRYELTEGDDHVNDFVEEIMTVVWGQKEGDATRKRFMQRRDSAESALATARERIAELEQRLKTALAYDLQNRQRAEQAERERDAAVAKQGEAEDLISAQLEDWTEDGSVDSWAVRAGRWRDLDE